MTTPSDLPGTAPVAYPGGPWVDRDAVIDDPRLAGVELCRALSDTTDDWLAKLFADAGAPDGVALVAVGGYGRRELSPQSDIDLLLLHAPKRNVDELAEKIWYPIWDKGLKLGHAVRTEKQALSLASEDLETATALLSMRCLAGDAALAAKLQAGALAAWRKRSKAWMVELGAGVRTRHATHGEVAFLLDPDLKDGRGGLRDVHAIRWAELAQPVLIPGDDTALRMHYETLLAARVELHRRTRRPGDRLILQEQDSVADALGYASADDLMRALSEAARSISWMSDEVWERIEHTGRGPGRDAARERVLGTGVVLRGGTVQVSGIAGAADDPLLVLRVAVAAAVVDARIDRRTLDYLAARPLPDPFPWSREARQLFADLFFAGRPAIAVIEALDRWGLWAQILPEWAAVRCKPQRNAYHTFTVDRHLCEAAVNAAELIDRVDRPELLVVGTLLHDIGKGYPGDHTEVGIDIIAVIAERMGFRPDDVATLQDMVRYHLLLPEVATRRDLSDDGTIESVANAVEDERTLRLLAALTEADSKATGTSAWNTWKAQLLGQLVERVTHVLGGGDLTDMAGEAFPTPSQRARMAEGHQVIDCRDDRLVLITRDRPGLFSRVSGVLALAGLDVLDAAAYTDDNGMALEAFTVAPRLASTIPWDRVVRDLELVLTGRLALSARLEERARVYDRVTPSLPIEPRVEFDTTLSHTATVVEVHAGDAVGVLYRITRALAELELDIRSAKVQTFGNEAIDAFYVCHGDGSKPTDPEVLRELERAVLHALES